MMMMMMMIKITNSSLFDSIVLGDRRGISNFTFGVTGLLGVTQKNGLLKKNRK